MAQLLRELGFFAEDPDSFPSTHIVAQNCLFQYPLLTSGGTRYTDIHASKTLIHTKNSKKIFFKKLQIKNTTHCN